MVEVNLIGRRNTPTNMTSELHGSSEPDRAKSAIETSPSSTQDAHVAAELRQLIAHATLIITLSKLLSYDVQGRAGICPWRLCTTPITSPTQQPLRQLSGAIDEILIRTINRYDALSATVGLIPILRSIDELATQARRLCRMIDRHADIVPIRVTEITLHLARVIDTCETRTNALRATTSQ